jgi:hypothetical protein
MKLIRMSQTIAKYPKYDDNILEGTKSIETKQDLKDNTKQTVTARQNLILETKENTIQMTLNLIYNIRIPRKQKISVYRSFYYV